MTDSRDEHERYGYTPSVSDGDLPGWLRSEADYAARMPAPWVMLTAAADTIERLRKERDEARRELCRWSYFYYEEHIDLNAGPPQEGALEEAERRGWDCFKEDKPCQ